MLSSDNDEVESERLDSRARELVKKYELELDTDTEEIILAIVKEGLAVKDLKSVLTVDFAIRQQLKIIYDESKRDSTRQRALEFVCELLGYTQSSSTKNAMKAVEVAFGVANEIKAQDR